MKKIVIRPLSQRCAQLILTALTRKLLAPVDQAGPIRHSLCCHVAPLEEPNVISWPPI
jgi:hypothetical protein